MGIVLLAVTFIAGLIAGIALDKRYEPHLRSRQAVLAFPTASVLDQLLLTPAQQVRADSITNQREPRSEAVMQQTTAHLDAISDSIDNELLSILTPSQRARLDSLRSGRILTGH